MSKYFDGELISAYEDLNKEFECKKENVKLHEKIDDLEAKLTGKDKTIAEDEVVYLLNQQDKRIKELEEENQQLKQQLHDLPKKIVEEIRYVLNGNDIEIQDNIYLTDILDTILKKYGGEDDLR